jgi:hypothetical protein
MRAPRHTPPPRRADDLDWSGTRELVRLAGELHRSGIEPDTRRDRLRRVATDLHPAIAEMAIAAMAGARLPWGRR